MKTTYLATAAAIAFAAPSPASAATSFQFSYGCSATVPVLARVSLGDVATSPAVSSCATVRGSFDLDRSGGTLPEGDYFTTFSNGVSTGPISNVRAVVEGAGSGNGTFGPSDFSMVTFRTTQDLDLGRDLVGQGGFGSQMDKFGDSDFNVFAAAGSSAPTGAFANYTAYTDAGRGDLVRLESLKAVTVSAVPEPTTWATMLMGMGIVGAAMRRRGRRGTFQTA